MKTIKLNKHELHLGGFAGLKEHRLVVDRKIGGNQDTFDGIGHFVYLADAYFMPNGETRMHPHKEIDVISIMIDGNIIHEGSLKNGQNMQTNQAQTQRAGAEGFVHNEINPDDKQNRMLQLWVLPEESGEAADYKFFEIEKNKLTTIYGGAKTQNKTLYSHTYIQVGIFSKDQKINAKGDFIAYFTRGTGTVNELSVKDGDILRGENLNFKSTDDDVLLVLITQKSLSLD